MKSFIIEIGPFLIDDCHSLCHFHLFQEKVNSQQPRDDRHRAIPFGKS
jgi:hypothetical protein